MNLNKYTKRVVTILLSFVMIAGLIPSQLYADTSETQRIETKTNSQTRATSVDVPYNKSPNKEVRIGINFSHYHEKVEAELVNVYDASVEVKKTFESEIYSGKTRYFKFEAPKKAGTYIVKFYPYDKNNIPQPEWNFDSPMFNLIEGKKAIIILPGIAGSKLYANQTVDTDSLLSDENTEFGEFAKFLKKYADEFYFDMPTYHKGFQFWEPVGGWQHPIFYRKLQIILLSCYEDGTSILNIYPEKKQENSLYKPIKVVDDKLQYGALDTYSKLVNKMWSEFNSDYDIYFFSYDWRLDNKYNAELLERFINDENYQEVTIVAHSMGGLLASEYLKRNPDNQNKIKKLITIGTPYLGAPKSLYILETGNFLDSGLDIFVSKSFKELSGNLYSTYQLLPPKKYFDYNDTTYVKKTGVWYHWIDPSDLNYDETYQLISSRNWAKDKSGNIKNQLSTANSFYDEMFDGDNHIIKNVDSYLIVGYGQDTATKVVEKFNKKNNCVDTDIEETNAGDGTVPLASSIIGGQFPNNKIYIYNYEHKELAEEDKVIQKVTELIKGQDKKLSQEQSLYRTTTNEKGWIVTKNNNKRIKLRIDCPLNLSILDKDGNEWAKMTQEYIENSSKEKGNLYTLGENNEIKIAYLKELNNKILINGIEDSFMNYTASIFNSGYETDRVVFRNVPLTKDTKIYTSTDFDEGLKLELDEDSDGVIDKIIEPSVVYSGSDLELEIGKEDSENYSNYGLISKNALMSTNLASKKLSLDTNILSNGLLSIISDDFDESGIFNTKSYILNAKNKTVLQTKLAENFEDNLKKYIENFIPNTQIKDIDNANVIGNTYYIKYNKFRLNKSLNVENHLRYNTKEFITEKPVVLFSKEGDISIIATDKFDFNGVIYAPNGTVTITGKNIDFNGVIVADKIFITGEETTIKNNLNLFELRSK